MGCRVSLSWYMGARFQISTYGFKLQVILKNSACLVLTLALLSRPPDDYMALFVSYCSFIVNTCYQTHGIDYTNLWLFSQKYYSGIWLGEIQWFWLKNFWLGFFEKCTTVFLGISSKMSKICTFWIDFPNYQNWSISTQKFEFSIKTKNPILASNLP